jgi:hypothetical protein
MKFRYIGWSSLFLLPSLAQAASPWLPIPGATSATLSYVHQDADEFFAGKDKVSLPSDLEQDTYSLSVEYGVLDQLAAFAELGYATSDFAPSGDNDEGLTDSKIGVAWRIVDEAIFPKAPTVTVRAAWIIEGDYETGRLDAIGDGASGYELSAIVGRQLLPQLAVWGEVGYRNRDQGVPSDVFYEADVSYTFLTKLTATVGYLFVRSDGDLDIGGPGFTEDKFPLVEEDVDLFKIGLSYAVLPHTSVGVNYAHVEDGRNTSISNAYGVSLSYNF